MKRILPTIFILALGFHGFSDDLKHEMDTIPTVTVDGKIEIANAGFAPIPAFSFNSPLITGFLSLKKKRFSYDTDLAVGVNGDPWMINNLFGVKILNREKFNSGIRINPSVFFKIDSTDAGEKIIHAQRNFSVEATAEFRVTKNWIVNLQYMRNNACDVGALSGNFLDIRTTISPVLLSRTIYLDVCEQLFFFDFAEYEGLFTSANLRVHHNRIPLSIFFQGVLPLWSSFPGNKFKWNTGIAYTF